MFKLIIEWTPGGELKLDGPVGDKAVAYAMLELAKDAVRVYEAKESKSPILIASAANAH